MFMVCAWLVVCPFLLKAAIVWYVDPHCSPILSTQNFNRCQVFKFVPDLHVEQTSCHKRSRSSVSTPPTHPLRFFSQFYKIYCECSCSRKSLFHDEKNKPLRTTAQFALEKPKYSDGTKSSIKYLVVICVATSLSLPQHADFCCSQNTNLLCVPVSVPTQTHNRSPASDLRRIHPQRKFIMQLQFVQFESRIVQGFL